MKQLKGTSKTKKASQPRVKSGLRGFRVTLLHKVYGARGRTRTGTKFPSRDFKSLVSTNSTTRAMIGSMHYLFIISLKLIT